MEKEKKLRTGGGGEGKTLLQIFISHREQEGIRGIKGEVWMPGGPDRSAGPTPLNSAVLTKKKKKGGGWRWSAIPEFVRDPEESQRKCEGVSPTAQVKKARLNVDPPLKSSPEGGKMATSGTHTPHCRRDLEREKGWK